MWKYLIPLICFINSCFSMYSSSDDVIELTDSNWQNEVMSSDNLWFIEFYAPWCGNCQSMTPIWKNFAKTVKGVVKVGAVDVDKNKELAAKFSMSAVPTIKIFGHEKQSPSAYSGARTHAAFVSSAIHEVRTFFDHRQGKSSGSGSAGGDGPSKGSIELTSSNFDEKVLRSNDLWLVGFFAPWCGHCQSLKPSWEAAASELAGKINLGSVDATVHQDLASKYQVRGYPTIKFFKGGPKGEPEEYSGGRSKDDIIAWAMDKVRVSIPPPEVVEATSAAVVSDNCMGKQLCIMSVLPVLLDCQANCRNDYLKMLKKTAASFKEHNWGWIWFEAVAQPKAEKTIDVGGFGYPAMAAVNDRKKKFALLRGSFSESGIHEFLRDLSLGRGSGLRELPTFPEFVDNQAWDGKDAAVPMEEEIDLSELGIKSEL